MRNTTFLVLVTFFAVSCSKNPTQSNSNFDTLPENKLTAPSAARCSQVSEIDNIQVRETLYVQIIGDVVSATFHYATGDKNSLTDSGFQHLLGKISKTDNSAANKTVLKLKDGTLATYFDEDFASNKDLSEISYDLKEKKVSFSLTTDERLTTVGGCQFE
jgi:hypothetical protein